MLRAAARTTFFAMLTDIDAALYAVTRSARAATIAARYAARARAAAPCYTLMPCLCCRAMRHADACHYAIDTLCHLRYAMAAFAALFRCYVAAITPVDTVIAIYMPPLFRRR